MRIAADASDAPLVFVPATVDGAGIECVFRARSPRRRRIGEHRSQPRRSAWAAPRVTGGATERWRWVGIRRSRRVPVARRLRPP